MNVVAGQVSTRLVLDSADYTKRLQMAANYTKDFAKTANTSTSSVGRDFQNLARSVIGFTASFQAIKKTLSEGMNFNRFVQEQTAAFTVMLKSVDAARDKIAELYDFAVKSPLTFKETVGASKQLLAYGFAADSLVDNMKMLGTVAKATGHSLDDISYVYGTLKSQGRAYSRDLMQFAMRGIPIYEELAQVMGVPIERLKKLTETGQVGFKEVEKAFKNMTAEGGRFAGMMDEYMKTLGGQLSMLGDIAQQSAGALAGGITNALTEGVGGIMDALSGSSGVLQEIGEQLGWVTSGLLKLVAATIKLLPLLKVLFTAYITAKAMALLGTLPSIIGKIVPALGAATFQIQYLGLALSGSNFAGMFSGIISGFKALGAALVSFAANPAVLAIIAVGAGIAVISSQLAKAKAAERNLRETNPKEAMRQSILRYQATREADDPIQYTTDSVRALAKEFQVSVAEAALLLKEMGVLTEGRFKQIADSFDAATEKAMQDILRARKDAWIKEAEWFAGLTGKEMGRYVQPGNTFSDSDVAANDYIKSFEDARSQIKAALGGAVFKQEELEGMLGDEKDALVQALKDAYAAGIPITKQFYPIIQQRILEINKLLEKGSKKAVEIVKQDQWYLRELQAKVTDEKYDDLKLAYDKEIVTATDKYYAELHTLEWFNDAKKAIDEKYAKDRLELYAQELDDMYALYTKGDAKKRRSLQGSTGLAYYNMDILGAQASDQFKLAKERRASGHPGAAMTTAIAWDTMFQSVASGFEGLLGSIQLGFGETFLALADPATRVSTALNLLGEAAADVASQLMSQILEKVKGIDISQSIDNMSTGIANFINNIFGLTDATEDLADEIDDLKDKLDGLRDQFDALVDRAEELIDQQVSSMQDLYEVGAISGAQYQASVDTLNDTHQSEMEQIYALMGEIYPDDYARDLTLSQVYEALKLVATNIGITNQEIAAAETTAAAASASTTGASDALTGLMGGAAVGAAIGSVVPVIGTAVGAIVGGVIGGVGGFIGDLFGWWDVGATSIPKDQFGMVHAGEAIIPKTFADGIRSGEMVLSGNNTSTAGSGDVYVTVNVSGSVATENDLAASIAKNIYTQRRRGLLTV